MSTFFKKYLLPMLPWLVLLYLLIYTVAYFLVLPYFDFRIESGHEIVALYIEENDTNLKIGDLVLEFNGIPTERFDENLLLNNYHDLEIGKPFNLTVQRGEEILTIEQTAKSFVQNDFYARLSSQWWFSFIFWMAGLVTFLNIRPRNTIWRLLVSFFFLISIWMLVSSGFSHRHFMGGAIILRVGILLTFPVIIHLHWIYPKPLNKKNKTPWWIIAFYIFGILASVLQVFQRIPSSLYVLVFLLSLVISIVLILIRVIWKIEQRQAYSIIAFFTLIAVIPGILISLATSFSIDIPYPLSSLTSLAFPLIPIAYLYSINRQKLGALEFRVNKIISLYLFGVFLGTTLILVIPLASNNFSISENGTLLAILSSLIFSVFSIVAYKPFQEYVENHILGIPHDIEDLKRVFSSELNTTLDNNKFKNLIENKVTASFLIRQSALLEIKNSQFSIIYSQAVEIPTGLDTEPILNISKYFSRFIQSHEQKYIPAPFKWAKLILPLYFEDKIIGIWGFGLRDPDDFYSAYDIESLQSLADQIAIAVVNHQQAQRLRTLYQQNIDRHESERARLARDLHDDTLNNMALLKQQSTEPIIVEKAEFIISDIRKIIQGLRPEMLTYGGLATALEDLGDLLSERQNDVRIETNIQSESSDIDDHLELHIFRIIQQACENALQHANAKSIFISGEIANNKIQLAVKDNGVGFQGSAVDFGKLLSEEHYGLAGMHERAALIKAKVHIHSTPRIGTEIQVLWEK